MEEWQGRLEKLATEYGETISSKVKLAILYGMMPREVQERLLDKCRGQWSTMKDDDIARTVVAVLEEVRSWPSRAESKSSPCRWTSVTWCKLPSTRSHR